MRLSACVVGLFLLADVSVAAAASASKACPGSAQPLLLIQRNKNENEVHYDACLGPHGGLDAQRPVDDHWIIVKAGRRSREEIGAFEAKAYGIKVDHHGGDRYDLTMNVMKKRKLRLVSVRGHWKVEGTINGKSAYLQRIYVTAKESFPIPRVQQVDIYGKDARTGADVHERILPNS